MRTVQSWTCELGYGADTCTMFHRTYFLFFNKFQLLSKTSGAKFRHVKTSSGKVVATSFLYLTVYRWIVGDVPIYRKFALKVTHTVGKRRFRNISLSSAAAVRANKKIQLGLSLIGSRQRAFQR